MALGIANFAPLMFSGIITAIIVVFESLRNTKNKAKRRSKRAVMHAANAASGFANTIGIGKNLVRDAKTFAQPTRLERAQNLYSDEIRKYFGTTPSEIKNLTRKELRTAIRDIRDYKSFDWGAKKRSRKNKKPRSKKRTRKNKTIKHKTRKNKTRKNKSRK